MNLCKRDKIREHTDKINFANYPYFMSLVLRQGEPHEMDYRFDPCFTFSKNNRATKNSFLCYLVETVGIEGASPSHLLRKLPPIKCPSCSAKANRTRWTMGSLPV